MMRDLVDKVIEAPVVTSFSRVGYEVRSRVDGWKPVSSYDLTGRVIVVTGGTSGIGFAAASDFAAAGATLVITGRRAEKNRAAVRELMAATSNQRISQITADMGELDEVRIFAEEFLASFDRLDVLVHNAGALINPRQTTTTGAEVTIASQVVGPFLLTRLLLNRLRETDGARVLTMSSGGMYGAALSVSNLVMPEASYNGTKQYAKAKRAQVTLNEMWATRHPEVTFHALHPGWVDTPGVDDAIPGFAKLMGPVLRTPAQGADTLVWLASDAEPARSNGEFWHDRKQRGIHKIAATRSSDTPEKRRELWEWVAARAITGHNPQKLG